MLQLHIALSIFSYGAFLIAFVSGILFLVLERQLKHKQLGRLFRWLPPLSLLDRLNYLSITIGFGAFSIGLVLGTILAVQSLGAHWLSDGKVWLSMVTWVAYAVLWSIRVSSSLRGRKVAILSILGFSLVLWTLFGGRYVLPTWHAYL
ncbi:MAG: cytochrome c biogenesis protein CcsA [Candidatus Omnitrophica bacterium]|nr:cytochrome c biogenesis protein CcsA [Candidatus Omnitrophota bacterium]